MGKSLLLTVVFLCLWTSSALADGQQFCFLLVNGENDIHLSIHLNDDGWKTGTVNYGPDKGIIKIRQKKTEILADVPGRPSDVAYFYEEIVKGKVNGIYRFSIQGAAFGDAYYLRLRDHKKFVMKRSGGDDVDCFSPATED